ncbi:MAG TPA: histidine phosphatase family protein, partial [Candidatus Caenarcaniphilales bacterium]
ELHNGILEGLTWSEAQTRYPSLCQALETSPEWLPIPGAEPLTQARDRALGFIQTLLSRHTNTDQIWIITHGGILQFLIAALLGCDRVWGLSINATALFEFWIDLTHWHRDQTLNPTLGQIRCFNDAQHLEALDEKGSAVN